MIKYCFLFLFTAATLIFSGCSKPPEEMSTVRPNLILNIFKLIKQNKHEEALVQIRKLRDLDPTNPLLPVLEETEKNNGDLQKINMLLQNSKSQEEVVKILQSLTAQRSSKDKELVRIAEKLKDMIRMDNLIDIIISPQPSFDSQKGFRPASMVLKDSVEEFVRLAQKWKIPNRLRNKVISRLANVSKLQQEEKLRSVQSLELFAPGLAESSYQTMMALSLYADRYGTK